MQNVIALRKFNYFVKAYLQVIEKRKSRDLQITKKDRKVGWRWMSIDEEDHKVGLNDSNYGCPNWTNWLHFQHEALS